MLFSIEAHPKLSDRISDEVMVRALCYATLSAGHGPLPDKSKEADVIETNAPTTETPTSANPPERDLVQTAREAGAAAQERVGDLREAAASSLDEAKSNPPPKKAKARRPRARRKAC